MSAINKEKPPKVNPTLLPTAPVVKLKTKKELRFPPYVNRSMTLREFFMEFQPFLKFDLNPITQRPPFYIDDEQNPKYKGIIDKTMRGMSLGIWTLVECGEDSPFDWESLDAGNRGRAIWHFYQNEITWEGRYYDNLSKEEKEYLLNRTVSLDIYEPMSNFLKGELFRILNGTADKPNNMEECNAFGDTPLANAIRWSVREYEDENHKLFNLTDAKNPKYTSNDNKRLKLEEFVARIYYRYYKDGFLGSRNDRNLKDMYYDENVKIRAIKEKVDKHLTFLFKLAKERKNRMTKIGWKELNTLSNIYHYFNKKFGLKGWTVFDHSAFYINFAKSYNDYLLDKNKKYGDVFTAEYEHADVTIKEAFKSYTTCHDSYRKQKRLVEWIVQHKDFKPDLSIRVVDPTRLFNKETKEGSLALQGFICAVEETELKYEDAEAAHDIAHILGGSSKDPKNCIMVRTIHNQKMNTMTVKQYKELNGYPKK